jgi:hypothetical protein
MKAKHSGQDRLGVVEVVSDKLFGDATSRMRPARAQDVYEIRPRKSRDGVDLISDRLLRGPIWYAGPDAVRNAVAYAKYRSHSRSHRIIRVFDESGTAVETHESVVTSKSGQSRRPYIISES